MGSKFGDMVSTRVDHTRSLPLKELSGGRSWIVHAGRGENRVKEEMTEEGEDEFGSDMEGFNCSVFLEESGSCGQLKIKH